MSDHSTPGDITLDELGIDLKEFFQKGDSSFDGFVYFYFIVFADWIHLVLVQMVN